MTKFHKPKREKGDSFTIYLEISLMGIIDEMARAEGRTRSNVIEFLLKKQLGQL